MVLLVVWRDWAQLNVVIPQTMFFYGSTFSTMVNADLPNIRISFNWDIDLHLLKSILKIILTSFAASQAQSYKNIYVSPLCASVKGRLLQNFIKVKGRRRGMLFTGTLLSL